MMCRAWLIITCLSLSSSAAWAQQRATDIGQRLLQDRTVKAALENARAAEPRTIQDQIRLCQIAAPPFKEARRGQLYAQMFRELGLKNLRIDSEGNVLGERPGLQRRPHLVFSAHLDTVFPEGTDVTVKRDGPILRGPGVGDNCRGLAVLLAVVRAMNQANLQTQGTITFVGTVGEEGLGDLRGVKRLFGETLKGLVDRFVSVDGSGVGITNIAVGSIRQRVTFKGPGGHSYGAFGTVNPVHALGRAIARIGDFHVPFDPRTTFNVGRVGGGISVNTIANEAWMEIDLRSVDPGALKSLDARVREAVEEATAQENARWNSRQLSSSVEVVGMRPSGSASPSTPIVQAAISVTQALGLPISLAGGSTDANLPLSLDIPAVTIDGGGIGTGAHTERETFDSTSTWQGTQRALLLAIALTQP